jgi:hypothetical protein
MSVKANCVSCNSGTLSISRNNLRVNSTLPAPMKATLMGISGSLIVQEGIATFPPQLRLRVSRFELLVDFHCGEQAVILTLQWSF